ncbi:Hsp20/alpha crystallin family protein [Halorarum salinum]|uniref:Hsp20/alpha crystallin family protein n=1 Tax=Halorarum salinum TaxID=2743089 RepID=A0A7D5Q8Z2_9EURY|nr:Hsp20/alpha crystallin family protein [Halobaculum salinum]QLG61416.1 Hsp20/alpha crystallin family protein [Halobaculum salinum]
MGSPLVDVVETGGEVHVVVDLPGFDEEEITIQADDDTLFIAAERPAAAGETGGAGGEEFDVVRAERPRRLERTVRLPPNGDVDAATATYEDGVCTVTVPKAETTRRRIGFQ